MMGAEGRHSLADPVNRPGEPCSRLLPIWPFCIKEATAGASGTERQQRARTLKMADDSPGALNARPSASKAAQKWIGFVGKLRSRDQIGK